MDSVRPSWWSQPATATTPWGLERGPLVANIRETGPGVKHETRPGRPALRSAAIEREIVRTCAREAVINGKVPGESEWGQQVGLGERSVQDVRLQAGLNRRDIKAWIRERQTKEALSPEEGVLC